MKLRITYNAPVVLTFAIASGAVLLLTQWQPSWLMLFVSGRRPLDSALCYITPFTYIFGHASLEHYAGNMMLFLLLGPGIEEKYGSGNTILIMTATALFTAIINMILSPNGITGCSGIVFAFIILSSMTSYKKGEIPLTLVIITVLYLGQEVVSGLTNMDEVSQLGHVLGGLCGGISGFLLNSNGQNR